MKKVKKLMKKVKKVIKKVKNVMKKVIKKNKRLLNFKGSFAILIFVHIKVRGNHG